MKYGFREDLVVIEPEAWKLGGVEIKGEALNPSGDWSKFLPKYEAQAERYETQGCTVWGSQNQVETLHKFLFQLEPNYSELYNYIFAGVDPYQGANPQKAYESFRHDGLIDNDLYELPDDFNEFLKMIKDEPPKELQVKGQQWLNEYEITHDWIISPTHETLKDNLKYCPIGVSVTAWFEENGVYVDKGQSNTHWVVLYGFDGENPLIFDSYDHSKKKLSPDHRIAYAKRMTLKKRLSPRVSNPLANLFSWLLRCRK